MHVAVGCQHFNGEEDGSGFAFQCQGTDSKILYCPALPWSCTNINTSRISPTDLPVCIVLGGLKTTDNTADLCWRTGMFARTAKSHLGSKLIHNGEVSAAMVINYPYLFIE